jgi:hypothetical protein
VRGDTPADDGIRQGYDTLRWYRTAAYYAAALLCGSLFAALAYYLPAVSSWAAEGRLFSGFSIVYGMSLAGGAAAALVTALVLRLVTAFFRIRSLPGWLGIGITVGLGVPWVFAEIGYLLEATYFPAAWQPVKRVVVFPFMGPMMYVAQPLWVRGSVALATTAVLYAVARPGGTGGSASMPRRAAHSV